MYELAKHPDDNKKQTFIPYSFMYDPLCISVLFVI